MLQKVKTMGIYSICHFLVDFLSCIFVLGVASQYCMGKESIYFAEVVIYNFFAFAFQVPLGMIMDKFKIYKYVGMLGFCIIGICYVWGPGNPILLASLVGIGNALFHLEGGVNAFEQSKGTAFLNGLFVAPGAMGIFLGTAFHNQLAVTYWPIIMVFFAIALLTIVQNKELPYITEEQERIEKEGSKFKYQDILAIALLIGVSIVVRSIGGSAIQYGWKTGFIIGLLYTILVVLGKMFGGFIADRVGLKKTAIIALSLACVSLIAGFTIPFFGYIGIFLFNVPMSITLLLIEKCNTKNLAVMVGLNTFFLFIGYLICMIPNAINNYVVLITSIILAIVSIYFAFQKIDKSTIL